MAPKKAASAATALYYRLAGGAIPSSEVPPGGVPPREVPPGGVPAREPGPVREAPAKTNGVLPGLGAALQKFCPAGSPDFAGVRKSLNAALQSLQEAPQNEISDFAKAEYIRRQEKELTRLEELTRRQKELARLAEEAEVTRRQEDLTRRRKAEVLEAELIRRQGLREGRAADGAVEEGDAIAYAKAYAGPTPRPTRRPSSDGEPIPDKKEWQEEGDRFHGLESELPEAPEGLTWNPGPVQGMYDLEVQAGEAPAREGPAADGAPPAPAGYFDVVPRAGALLFDRAPAREGPAADRAPPHVQAQEGDAPPGDRSQQPLSPLPMSPRATLEQQWESSIAYLGSLL